MTWRSSESSPGSVRAGQDCGFAPRGGALLSAILFLYPKLLLDPSQLGCAAPFAV